MRCPFCTHQEDKVVDSRSSREGIVIRRRRECLGCQRRYTTYERVEEVLPLVVKKDGRREPFDRTKILQGLKKACEKRPVGLSVIEEVVDRVEKKMLEMGEPEIPSRVIGEEVMTQLHGVDQVAYVRFASVYREFKDVTQFMDELTGLLKDNRRRDARSGP
ncbi:MAG: transcriptional regulator NrdR [Nitrospirae bacterium RIFCSPHIGHO2_01_FULL_66_17]|jgi:transcriptional repressor NrdR|nr:MAG: transcriptional regulator NrdR [Nitrospirae bacterium RIFCSPHIGHO2_01_FULL_66_17]